ncbi:MAG: phosphoribosylanthranilate isomerase [Candidatus Flemingiibacterium sp.]
MTETVKIKLCGLTRVEDIAAVNRLLPDYIGFVFAKKSRRYVSPERAAELKALLDPRITAVGVFVNETPENIANLLESGVIDAAQLHGDEDEEYISSLRKLTDKTLIKAFKVNSVQDVIKAESSSADLVLLDSGAGTGSVFDWELIRTVKRRYFLAGGLDSRNVGEAIETLHPWAVDVSSGIETGGIKDEKKMADFISAAGRKGN